MAADAGSPSLPGLLDLSAAFDIFNHGILLNRLRHTSVLLMLPFYGLNHILQKKTVLDWKCKVLGTHDDLWSAPGVCTRTPPFHFVRFPLAVS